MGRIYLLLAAVLLGASVHAGSLYVPSSQGATATHGRVTEFDATTGQFKRQTVGACCGYRDSCDVRLTEGSTCHSGTQPPTRTADPGYHSTGNESPAAH